MSYRKYVTKCRNPHKELRYETSARALYKSHRSCFEPSVPAEELTERQQMLLDGAHPNPVKREVSSLLRKLRYYNRNEEAKRVFGQYKHFFHESYEDGLSLEEGISILDELTPSNFETTK